MKSSNILNMTVKLVHKRSWFYFETILMNQLITQVAPEP